MLDIHSKNLHLEFHSVAHFHLFIALLRITFCILDASKANKFKENLQ